MVLHNRPTRILELQHTIQILETHSMELLGLQMGHTIRHRTLHMVRLLGTRQLVLLDQRRCLITRHKAVLYLLVLLHSSISSNHTRLATLQRIHLVHILLSRKDRRNTIRNPCRLKPFATTDLPPLVISAMGLLAPSITRLRFKQDDPLALRLAMTTGIEGLSGRIQLQPATVRTIATISAIHQATVVHLRTRTLTIDRFAMIAVGDRQTSRAANRNKEEACLVGDEQYIRCVALEFQRGKDRRSR